MSLFGNLFNVIHNIKTCRDVKYWYASKNIEVHEYIKRNVVPELSLNDKKEIDRFWSQYGIKIKDYSWFQWYYFVTGQHDPCFIPQDIYSGIIWPFYNNEEFQWAWTDKNFFERFLPDVRFPRVILRKVNGQFYTNDWDYISSIDISKICKLVIPEKEIILKDSIDSGEGRGVKKYTVSCEEDIKAILQEWKSSNYIMQEVIHQHDFFASFNNDSVNIIRITSVLKNGQVTLHAPTVRIGIKGSITDICYVDGKECANVLGISEEGKIKNEIVNQDGKHESIVVTEDDVPCWDEIKKIIQKEHLKLPHFGIIGWDFIVNQDSEVVCIEYNVRKPGTVFYQYVNGPFFGKHTEEVLEFLKNKKNQEFYIPSWMRISKGKQAEYIPLWMR